MKDREHAALAAGLCLTLALLRMLAPALPFDWKTLALVALAVLSLLLMGGRHVREQKQAPEPSGDIQTGIRPEAIDGLRARFDAAGWPERTGGLFDALKALQQDKPFAAACAARGMLLLLTQKASLSLDEAELIAQLSGALDALAKGGEAIADTGVSNSLFDMTLRAIGRMEAWA